MKTFIAIVFLLVVFAVAASGLNIGIVRNPRIHKFMLKFYCEQQFDSFKMSCTIQQCTDLCNQVFPGRRCVGLCLSPTECQCTCIG